MKNKSKNTKLTTTESVDVQSAGSYSLVGFIFYILSALGFLVPLIFFGIFTNWLNEPPFNANIPSGIGILMFFATVIPLALTVSFAAWTWITIDNIKKGKYAEARTATLILGIFGIFLAWLIGGIFLLLAYGKLGTAQEGPKTPQAKEPLQQKTGRICVHCGKPIDWDAKFCEHCGKGLDQ